MRAIRASFSSITHSSTFSFFAIAVMLIASTGCKKDSPTASRPPSMRLVDAAMRGQIENVKEALDAGADIQFVLPNGNSALHYACAAPTTELMALLLDCGARVEAANALGETPLHIAARHGSVEKIEELIERGAEIDQPTNEGDTPLMFAAEIGCKRCVEMLLSHDAEVNARSKTGCTPLHDAVLGFSSSGKDAKTMEEVMMLLIEHGADVNAQVENGDTPLHLTAIYGSAPMARILLENGADPNVKNKQGETTADLATKQHRNDILATLQQRGVGNKSPTTNP